MVCERVFWCQKIVLFFEKEILPSFHNGGRTGECHKTKTKNKYEEKLPESSLDNGVVYD